MRRWRQGVTPDAEEAVAGPLCVSRDLVRTRRLLDLVPQVPALTWGRDELHAGEMWNCNSLIAWLLARTGHETAGIDPPSHGRAPGWDAGLVLAARQSGRAQGIELGRASLRGH